MSDRDLTKTYSRSQFVQKLRRLAGAVESGKAFTRSAGRSCVCPRAPPSTSSTSAPKAGRSLSSRSFGRLARIDSLALHEMGRQAGRVRRVIRGA